MINIRQNRRKKPDTLVKCLPWFVGLTWTFVLLTIVLFGNAKPRFETVFDRWLVGRSHYYEWNVEFLRLSYLSLTIVAGLSVTGFWVNQKRHRRKTDTYRYTMIICGVLSILGMVILPFFF